MYSFKRSFVVVLVGCLFAAIAFLAAWSGSRAGISQHGPGSVTERRLKTVMLAIAAYTAEHADPPAKLAVLFDGGSIPTDGWGRAFVYEVHGSEYEVMSFGQDGQPGGEGVDRDISGTEVMTGLFTPQEHALNLQQFIADEGARKFISAYLLCLGLGLWFGHKVTAPGPYRGERSQRLGLYAILIVLASGTTMWVIGNLEIIKYH